MTIGSKANLKIELINVGHGDSILLHWEPDNGSPSTIIIDGGTQLGASKIKEALGKVRTSS